MLHNCARRRLVPGYGSAPSARLRGCRRRGCPFRRAGLLSVFSLAMLLGIEWGAALAGKLDSPWAFVCDTFGERNAVAEHSATIFLWSKYLEWGDTLFLRLSGKPTSMLQYTHHMSTGEPPPPAS